MSTGWVILIGGGVLAAGLVVWLLRRELVRDWDAIVTFTKGRIMTRDALQGLTLVVMAIFVIWSIDRLNDLRESRLDAELAQVVTKQRLDAVERRTRAYARFLAPSERDVLEIVRRYRRICARSAQCRRDFAASINQVLRVENSRIVPAPQDARPAPAPQSNGGASPFPRPAPPPEIITVPGPQGKPGPQGPRGESGRNVDSALVDGLENRIADVERGLQALLGRIPGIERVLALLCRTPLRICG
jgi:hypothetical protein